jgi:cell division transport system permease protein
VRLAAAIAYFFAEAARRLLRSWGASLVAVLAIAVSLWLVGVFWLVGRNVAARTVEWERDARLVVFARLEASEDAIRSLGAKLAALPWVKSWRHVSPDDAAARFSATFPVLAEAVGESQPFPHSFEIVPASPPDEQELAALGNDPAVDFVEDDGDLVRQLRAGALALRLIGGGLVLVLLAAALFTIGSIIRLKAYRDEEEISILRLVGGTEFFIRGPFLAEGLLQGLVGSGVALAAIRLGAGLLRRRLADLPLAASFLRDDLGWMESLTLLGLGALSGFAGAALSLRREKLGSLASE